jgi:hypothetical protein
MKHRTLLLVIAAVVVSLGAGAALAYFTSSGSAHGSASTATLLTVTAGAGTPSTPLLPGGTGDVALTVTNPNNFAVTLVSVAGNGAITADGGHPGCTTTGVTFTAPTGSPLPVTILANSTNQVVDLPGAAAMSLTASNACQGATFSIPVTIVVHK